nr:RNA-directed DNA polymerase, eukaryota [Tanacetum cinerariifolium]
STTCSGLGHKTKKKWIKALVNSHKINFLAIQETKMLTVSHMDVKFKWGNSNYDFVCSDSLGNSGGILCIWEASIFKKDYVTISDNFIAIYGTCLPCNSKILFIVVYAPQQVTYKRCLWDYISTIIGRWNGESIVMGDFNEVRTSDERRGSSFNPYGAKYFDRFIVNLGLIDVTLEGFSFTWSHPLALKMSKLDRFLVSEEVHMDFGPIPFRFYHSWFDFVGFDDMIKLSWASLEYSNIDGMTRFKKKLQDLKWLEAIKVSLRKEVEELKQDKREVVSKVVPYAAILVGKLVSSAILFERCKAYEQVDDIKEPFDLSKVNGYRSSYKKDHTQANKQLSTATFPWLDEFVAEPSAPIEALLSKKPLSL